MAKGNNHHPSTIAAASDKPPRRRSPLPLVILAALFIIVPFLTWYGTWFGRDLSDEQIGKYLADEKKPRHIQHALSQVAERMGKRDASAKPWYPQLVALADSPVMEFRLTVAWLMGQDNQAEEFHTTLLRLLHDREPLVRRNAALSLVTFADTRGLPELRAMLHPYAVTSPSDGTLSSILPQGTPIKMGGLLARIAQAENQIKEVRSPLTGKISNVAAQAGDKVVVGQELASIAPDGDSVWEALRALYLVGERVDLPAVERYAQGVEAMPEKVKQQAALTAKAIQSRMGDERSISSQ